MKRLEVKTVVNWTKEQQLAIDKTESNILLSAAAGSGKTAVLTERIVNIMEQQQIDINRFLVFTFSRAAANEMKERAYKKIIEGLEKEGYEDFYRDQLMKINQAKITTIHSFCNEVVRSHFFILGIDPDYRIGEPTEFVVIKNLVLEDIFEDNYRNHLDDFVMLVETFGNQRGDDKLKQLVLEIHNKLQSQPDYNIWFDEIIDVYDHQKIWLDRLKNTILSEIELAMEYSEKALEIAETESGSLLYTDFFTQENESIKNCYEATKLNLLDFKIEFKRLPSDKSVDDGVKSRIKELRDYYKNSLNSIQKSYYLERDINQHSAEFAKQKSTIEHLIEIVRDFDEQLMMYKKEKNILEFSDLEHFALEVLSNDEISKSYQEKFEYVFVDEYQDSNYIQEAIISRVKSHDNLFMVGDLKQSIYKFRLAEPDLFASKYRTFERDEDALNFKLDLNKNFRSRGNILGFINQIFYDFMTDDFGGMNYDEKTMLYQGNESFIGEDPPVEIHLIKTHSGDLLKEEIEVYEIADRILELKVNEGVQFRDIVILMRSPSTYVKYFSKIFETKGIPLFADVSERFLDTMEVQQLINYLKIIDNPKQDIPLVSLMRSPIYQFTDEELYQIRQRGHKEYFHECMMAYKESDDIQEKIDVLIKDIALYREKSRFLPIDELIWDIYIGEGYNTFFTGLPLGEQRDANVKVLIDIASEFESKKITSLNEFMIYIDHMKEKKSDFESAKIINEKANVVRLMSIHKSKGLEFPVVIFAGTGKRFNQVDAQGDIVVHSKLGIISKYFDIENRIKRNTFHKDLVAQLINSENSAEEMRILYVALTRAMDRLIIFSSINNKRFDKDVDHWNELVNFGHIENNIRFIDWIMYNIRTKKDVAEPDVIIRMIDSSEKEYKASGVSVSSLNQDEFKNMMQEKIQTHEEKLQLPELIEMDWKQAKSKISVTKIAHQSLDELSHVETRYFPSGEVSKKDSAALMGTEVHKIMQLLDFKKLESMDMFLEQIKWMISHSMIDSELPEKFQMELIYDFFISELGKRLLASQTVFREKAFVLKKDSDTIVGYEGEGMLLIQGIIDCYFVEEGQVVLIDFKSDQVNDMTYTHSIPKYSIQLDLYAEAIENLTGYQVKEKFIHFLRNNESYKIS